MAETSFYKILGLAPAATPEEVRAAHEKLSAQHGLAGTPEGKARLDAINEAFATLSDPARRARYDMALEVREKPVAEQVETIQPALVWAPRALAALFFIAVFGAFYYFYYAQEEEQRIAAEKAAAAQAAAAAATKAREADEKARAESEAAAWRVTNIEESQRQTAEAVRQREIAAQKRKDDETIRRNVEANRHMQKAQEKQMDLMRDMMEKTGVPVDIPEGKPSRGSRQ